MYFRQLFSSWRSTIGRNDFESTFQIGARGTIVVAQLNFARCCGNALRPDVLAGVAGKRWNTV
jgi:hypothetical protein